MLPGFLKFYFKHPEIIYDAFSDEKLSIIPTIQVPKDLNGKQMSLRSLSLNADIYIYIFNMSNTSIFLLMICC